MNTIGVITGDIVHSTRISDLGLRTQLTDSIKLAVEEISATVTHTTAEIYRGDSIQIIVSDATKALRVAVLLRTALRKNSPKGAKWDARLSVGVGQSGYTAGNIAESDGEAFRYSGREFDELGKTRRLILKTPWDDVDNEFRVSTPFADHLLSGWTISQAEVIYPYLMTKITQKELALELNKSPQLVNKLLNTARCDLMEIYLERYEYLIRRKLNS
ncbi:hypothetical protein [Dysgonomonas sp. BGC7]|uniref:hypothetical protein n=1 Tax=Dysgonomonas sp. BGC7 TaxID=1658008 RepID=UPI0006835192|nr:hypothetical protein [Dysgonomonas sp. BGC7]MBD8388228.1 hypothetical protein [Dysgonomonas sp. BGC7]